MIKKDKNIKYVFDTSKIVRFHDYLYLKQKNVNNMRDICKENVIFEHHKNNFNIRNFMIDALIEKKIFKNSSFSRDKMRKIVKNEILTQLNIARHLSNYDDI